MMKWDGQKISVYSGISAVLFFLLFIFFFSFKPFSCHGKTCVMTLASVFGLTYCLSYSCFWFFTRFGNLKGVESRDEF